ncbi:MAG: NUDIX hydrolase [Candidatus Ozemobacteraceae bacterium]
MPAKENRQDGKPSVCADGRSEMPPRRGRGPNARLIARCLCFDNDHLLLVRHRSPRTGCDFWTLPGGFTETGETLAEAGRRELLEETGLEGGTCP